MLELPEFVPLEDQIELKKCSKCGTTKSIENYYTNNGRPRQPCKECFSVEKNNPEKAAHRKRVRKSWHLQTVYGLTVEKFRLMLEEQAFSCACCYDPLSFDAAVVDHDHSTGKVRGLLCNKCNFGLGQFNDDPEKLCLAIGYLSA